MSEHDDAVSDDLWTELCEKDDRTSPEEYPDMVMLTRAELGELLSRRSPGGEVAAEWGYADTVGNLIAQLRTFDPALPAHGVFHADTKAGRQMFIRGLTISRERVNGRRIQTGDLSVPYSVVIWSADRRPKPAPMGRIE